MSNTKTAVKKETAKMEKVSNEKGTKAETAKAEKIQKATAQVQDILNPTADGRIKKLETFNRLAEKKQKIDTKLDELVNFNASNDGTLSKMEFSANNNYRFTISNPVTIGKLLKFVEDELRELREQTETEIVSFQI